jgi:hypothetical protein
MTPVEWLMGVLPAGLILLAVLAYVGWDLFAGGPS